jgi:hypothetical protein
MTPIMTLKEQDVLVLLKLLVTDDSAFTYPTLARALDLSASQVHAALKRATTAGLFNHHKRTIKRKPLLEFLIHGLKYVFVADRSGITRGMPTAHAAPPLLGRLAPSLDLPPVWPSPLGSVRGEGFQPLHKSAPEAALKDPRLYQLLALVDAIRAGRARERDLAAKLLEERLMK